jgi:hypothetical protein
MKIRCRTIRTLAVGLALPALAAQALTIDAKALARYDVSFVSCEAQFPDLKGRRDDAYLAMWRTKPTPQLRNELAAARKGTPYQAERKRVLDATAKGAAPAASTPIAQQCQALRSELQRNSAKP